MVCVRNEKVRQARMNTNEGQKRRSECSGERPDLQSEKKRRSDRDKGQDTAMAGTAKLKCMAR